MINNVHNDSHTANLGRVVEEKVTYNSLESKVIDDYNVKLLKEENRVLKNRSRIKFVSSDDAENHDVNNPIWKMNFSQKQRDRYATSKRWQTLLVPNPNVNLSCYNWRKKNMLSKPINNQEHIVTEDAPGYHIDQIYKIKEDKITNEFGKRYDKLEKEYQGILVADNQKSDQNPESYLSTWKSSETSDKDAVQTYENKKAALDLDFEENMKKIENARNEVNKILTYYRGFLNIQGDKERALEIDKLFYLTKAEFKQWIEREEIMDMNNDINI